MMEQVFLQWTQILAVNVYSSYYHISFDVAFPPANWNLSILLKTWKQSLLW